ncbi:hypothetical protein PANT_9c00195 [Moesziomyces antarcticus T-34]|uniref:sn-1-specific diacylglycerol lipase n=1 Tax=Pseudozyma antarctica (strain T-34) TaxID=1151754 RepID=M9LV93_PSEA3|nr:hypothetical protein PANT_9c00195 [Moesziomyces antarcticus T-34]
MSVVRDPGDPNYDDLERLPSSLSMDLDFRNKPSQPFRWVDDDRHSDDGMLTTDTSGPATPTAATTRSTTPHVVAYCGTEPKNVAITSGVRAWTKHQAYGASDALIKYATASPLLPQQIAEMVSNLSVIARVSLKAAAFFIEIILEAARDATGLTLGITRRALIGAIGTARAVHSITSGEAWDAKATGRSLTAPHPSFLSILDKYTAVGIYLVHHTFTLAELFTMGGFSLVQTGLTAGIAAADESVRTLDGIFGSNETSRALASFVTLVRGEVNDDPRFANDSYVSILAKLTKAVTAFAVLQNSTYKRSAKSMKMRVVYDCTILGEVEAKSWRSLMVGSGNFKRAQPAALLPSPAADDFESLSLQSPPRRTASLLTPNHHLAPSTSSTNLPTSRSRGYLGDGLCLTDIGPAVPHRNWGSGWSQSPQDQADNMKDDASLIEDLNFLVGTDGGEESPESSITDDQLPDDLRSKLQAYSDDQLRNGVVLRDGQRDMPKQLLRRIRKTDSVTGNRETVYEITTEIIETVETITTVEHVGSDPPLAYGSTGAPLDSSAAHVHDQALSSHPAGTLRRDVTSSKCGTETHSTFDGGHETKLEEDEEWCEIRTTDSRTPHAPTQLVHANTHNARVADEAGATSLAIPEAPNGAAANAALIHGKPRSDTSKMPVVLKTMTKKLIQKRKTLRRIELGDTRGDADAGPDAAFPVGSETADLVSPTPVSPVLSSVTATVPRPAKDKSSRGARRDAHADLASAKGADLGRGLNKVLKRAKHQLMGAQPGEARSSSRHLGPPASVALGPPPQTHTSSRSHTVPVAEATPLSSPSKSKRALPSVPPSSSHAKVRKGNDIDAKSDMGMARGTGKELPTIPHRGASQRSLFTPEPVRASMPSTPQGSLRESNRRRSRAPSVTSIRSFASRSHVSSVAAAGNSGEDGVDGAAFPQAHLVENLRRFMRYSSAVYGQNFMRILGIGSLDYFFPDTSKHHANVWAFAHHVGIPVDAILLNSFSEAQPLFTEQMSPLVNYVAVDDAAKAVVLTCRGTMGLSDILTDLTATFETIAVEGGRSDRHYQVHSGMLASTRRLCNENSTVMQTLRRALEENPDYGLVITGHSLGGGVAALAAVELSCPADLFRQQSLRQRAKTGRNVQHPRIYTPFVTSFDSGLPAGRPIHAYAYGVPAVASPDLSAHCKGLVTSVIHGHDFIPTLSLGMVRDFKNIAHALSEESESDVAREIVMRVLGTYRQRSALRARVAAVPEHLAALEAPRPQEAPLSERDVQVSRQELLDGKTRNIARDDNYQDPNLKEDDLDPFSYSSGGGRVHEGGDPADPELADWLWSLIKTIRADMDSLKLYPPGDVYCIESFAVFVTPRMQPDSEVVVDRSQAQQPGQQGQAGGNRAQAHRVILRYCQDVQKRFSEPVFAKSMMRDHIPTNYELCLSLLHECIVESSAS